MCNPGFWRWLWIVVGGLIGAGVVAVVVEVFASRKHARSKHNGTGCKPSTTSHSLPKADSEAAVGSSLTIVGFLDTTVPRLLTKMEQLLDKPSLSGEECRDIEQRLEILVAAVNKGGQSAQQVKATLQRVSMLKHKLTDVKTRLTKPETRDSEGERVQWDTAPENHCVVCDRNLGSGWHYYFESLRLGDTVGAQCRECNRTVCKEHIGSGSGKKHPPMGCPDIPLAGAFCLIQTQYALYRPFDYTHGTGHQRYHPNGDSRNSSAIHCPGSCRTRRSGFLALYPIVPARLRSPVFLASSTVSLRQSTCASAYSRAAT